MTQLESLTHTQKLRVCSVQNSTTAHNKVIISCGTTSHTCGSKGQGTGKRVIARGVSPKLDQEECLRRARIGQQEG